MRSLSICATRRFRLTVAAALAAAAVAATLTISQAGVTGAEKDVSAFTVAGKGTSPTTRPALRDSRDPLSTDETGYAMQLASTDASMPKDATNVRGEAGPEFLYLEMPHDVDSTKRQAVAVFYDYTANRTYRQLVDLTTGRVTSKSAVRLQPPPSPDETTAAISLAIAAQPPLPFAAQFEAAVGVPLISREQIGYVAGTWVFDGTTTAGSTCGQDRCVRVLATAPSGEYLGTSNFVINLSDRSVINLETA